METREFENVLSIGETSTVEFKRCSTKPKNDTYETVCSFANHMGGSIYLGVDDDGSVPGITSPDAALDIERNIANATQNPQLFSPATLVETERFNYHGKTVIRIWVPASSAVCRYKGQVYDRLADADVRINGDMQIAQMYLRKQNIYTEQRIYKGVSMDDLDADLLARVRTMAANRRPGHPWQKLDNKELLRSARLYMNDRGTGEKGITLAGVLLLGKDDVIADVLPTYKTDAVVRRVDKRRFDDRLVCRTNLVDAYTELSEFLRRALPDNFALNGDYAVSPRDIIIRELVSNSLIHREYLSPITAQITVTEKGIETSNASRPVFEGPINLKNFTPIPKNPIIADFFAQIGLADELGSGVHNLVHYTKIYSGGTPSLQDGLIFKAFVPLVRNNERRGNGEPDESSESETPSANGNFNQPAQAKQNKKNQELKATRKIETKSLAFSSVEDAAQFLLQKQGWANSTEVAELAGVNARTARRYFAKQIANGTLKAEGKSRGRRYVKTDPTEYVGSVQDVKDMIDAL
ncbi:putative DNA binding domain-containing protein [Bifidobacterium sp. ESL0728]|uniref:RNA-binding domain-containing protein n=1 Tax=Bifidobacterium sp. ESL0728 TaxID=2983220 RepID=UPI0023F9D5E0|nr:RNA-binding domain-containing protein [Bifidobacterium sp. ESL0728]WEV58868.1 putative DNA binding domain-containing protein [Bifidobacterium sp. ESL0728]